jgi:predicted O-methyltransferase YrrM
MEEKIDLIIGDAKKIIPKLNETYDIIFIDGDKRDYTTYYQLCKEKLNPKGLMIVDNVLWDGKILEENLKNDKMTRGIQEFNRLVTEDAEMTNFILPMRDGLMLIQRK